MLPSQRRFCKTQIFPAMFLQPPRETEIHPGARYAPWLKKSRKCQLFFFFYKVKEIKVISKLSCGIY